MLFDLNNTCIFNKKGCYLVVVSPPVGGQVVVIFLFFHDFHFLSAGIGFQCCTGGPSEENLIRQSSVSVAKQLRSTVFIVFTIENKCST